MMTDDKEWEVETEDDYSPNKFYIGGSRDNGETYGVRLPKIIDAEVQRIIEQRVFPQYRYKADFIRDAVFHRLHHLQNMTFADREKLNSVLRITAAMQEELEHRANLSTFRQIRIEWERHLQNCLEVQDIPEAKVLFNRYLKFVEDLTTTAPYIGKILGNDLMDIRHRYPQLQ